MAVTFRKKPIPGNRGFRFEIYEDEISTSEPIVRGDFYDKNYEALDVGSQGDVDTALVAATMIAADYTY